MVSPTPPRRAEAPAESRRVPTPAQAFERVAGRRNVSDTERWASSLAGGALIFLGLRSRSLPGWIAAGTGGLLLWRGATGHCPGYQTLGVDTARRGEAGARPETYDRRGIHVATAVTINRPAEELYTYWRDFRNLPRIMSHLQRVDVHDERRSHWVTEAPLGRTVEWDAEIINDEPDRLIAWRSLQDADVDSAGSVRFVPEPAGRGTQVKVTLDYVPPGGRLGHAVARLFGESPRQQIEDDLHRFKQQVEAGEMATNAGGEPRGPC